MIESKRQPSLSPPPTRRRPRYPGRRPIGLFRRAALHGGVAVDVELEVLGIDLLVSAVLADLLDRGIEGLHEIGLALADGDARALAEPFRIGVVGPDEPAARAFRVSP